MKSHHLFNQITTLVLMTCYAVAHGQTVNMPSPPKEQRLWLGPPIARPVPVKEIESPVPAPQQFELAPPETVRTVLQRWSDQAKWTFGPGFYTATGDIPVVAPASLGTDYKTAVRTLLESTAMGDLPLQPCFYANNVLRVVPRQELCSRP